MDRGKAGPPTEQYGAGHGQIMVFQTLTWTIIIGGRQLYHCPDIRALAVDPSPELPGPGRRFRPAMAQIGSGDGNMLGTARTWIIL
jgi:hypothetical protein